MKCKWIERTYYMPNGLQQKTRFCVGVNTVNVKHGINNGRTPIRKQENNHRRCKNQMYRLIVNNFSQKDIFVSLDYSPKGLKSIKANCENPRDFAQVRKAAIHDLRLFLGRMKKYYKKEGKEFKWMAVTSDLDGKTDKRSRIHHHIIISGISWDGIREEWKHGGLKIENLFAKQDQKGLCHYLFQQMRQIPDEKKFSHSRNVLHPDWQEELVENPDTPVLLPEGSVIIESSMDNITKQIFVEYRVPKPKRYTINQKRRKRNE